MRLVKVDMLQSLMHIVFRVSGFSVHEKSALNIPWYFPCCSVSFSCDPLVYPRTRITREDDADGRDDATQDRGGQDGQLQDASRPDTPVLDGERPEDPVQDPGRPDTPVSDSARRDNQVQGNSPRDAPGQGNGQQGGPVPGNSGTVSPVPDPAQHSCLGQNTQGQGNPSQGTGGENTNEQNQGSRRRLCGISLDVPSAYREVLAALAVIASTTLAFGLDNDSAPMWIASMVVLVLVAVIGALRYRQGGQDAQGGSSTSTAGGDNQV